MREELSDNVTIMIKEHNSNRLRLFVPMCFENTLLSYSKTIKENYVLAFCDYWGFDFRRDDIKKMTKISDYIGVRKEGFENLENFCGTIVKRIEHFEFEDLLADIKCNLKNGIPTIIHTDTYYLYWNRTFYQKAHTQHVSQVCGYDEKKKKVFIVDLDFPDKVFELSLADLRMACTFYFSFERVKNYKRKTAYELLNHYLNNAKMDFWSLKNRIICFSETFYEEFAYEKEFNPPYGVDEVLESNLIFKIRQIIKDRNLFMDFLEEVSKETEINFSKVIEGLFVSVSKWNHIINLLIKNSIIGWKNNINEKIKNVIIEISELEWETYNMLEVAMLMQCGDRKKEYYKDTTVNKLFFVPIYKYCNNKGLLCKSDNIYIENDFPGLTGLGEMILIDDEYKKGPLVWKNIQYSINVEAILDNIVCEGQEIIVENNKVFRGIGVLCCTEFGTNHESLRIIGEDKSEERVYFNSYDIADYNADNTIEVGASYSQRTNSIIREINVFTTNLIDFIYPRQVEKIVLPNCTNLHILAMTLYT